MKLLIRAVLMVLVVLQGSSSWAKAGTNGFIVPPWRGAALSSSGYWETFTAAAGHPGNRPDRPGANTAAVLIQTDPNAFLTGSGNIYNLTGTSRFMLTDITSRTVGTVVLQSRTIGSELDYGSLRLSWTNATGAHSLAPQTQVELNRGSQAGLGATVSWLSQWDLSGLSVTQYTVSFQAAAPSVSFDALTIDTCEKPIPLFTQPFAINDPRPVIDRWMYPHNAAPCDRPAASVFATFGDAAEVDTRHAQLLLGWDTASLVPSGLGPARYLISRCRITLTINRGQLFFHDPTPDPIATHLAPNHPSFQPDADPGRPIELFGVGFRNGYDAGRFDQCADFGPNRTGERNAYAVGPSSEGRLVDVSNNVGKTNAAWAPFEVEPFAIGQTSEAQPGQLVPSGAKMTFDLNLANPFVLAYLQDALNTGRLRFMVSSLHPSSGQFGAPDYPDFATHFNEAAVEPTRLELAGVAVGDGDVDSDGLPDDWERFALRTLSDHGHGDADADGISNQAEYETGTDPLSAVSGLRILSPTRDATDGLALRFPTEASRRYQVEISEDLEHWTPLTNAPVFELKTGVAAVTDGPATHARRAYRIRSEAIRP